MNVRSLALFLIGVLWAPSAWAQDAKTEDRPLLSGVSKGQPKDPPKPNPQSSVDICHPEQEYPAPPEAKVVRTDGNLVLFTVPRWSKHNVGLAVEHLDASGRYRAVEASLSNVKGKSSKACQRAAETKSRMDRAYGQLTERCQAVLACEEVQTSTMTQTCLPSAKTCASKQTKYEEYVTLRDALGPVQKACALEKKKAEAATHWSVVLPAPRAGAGPVQIRLRFRMRATDELDTELLTSVAATLARLTIRAGYILRDVGHIRDPRTGKNSGVSLCSTPACRAGRETILYARLNQLLQDTANESRPCLDRYSLKPSTGSAARGGKPVSVELLASGFLGLSSSGGGGSLMVTRDSLDLARGRLVEYLTWLCRYDVSQACQPFLKPDETEDRTKGAKAVGHALRQAEVSGPTSLINGRKQLWASELSKDLKQRLNSAFLHAVPEARAESILPVGRMELTLEVAESIEAKKKSPYWEIAAGVVNLPELGETIVPALVRICPARCLKGDEIFVRSWEEAGRALSFDFGIGVSTLDQNNDPRRGDNVTLFTGLSYELLRVVSLSGGISIFENAQNAQWTVTPYVGVTVSLSEAVQILSELRGVDTKLVKRDGS